MTDGWPCIRNVVGMELVLVNCPFCSLPAILLSPSRGMEYGMGISWLGSVGQASCCIFKPHNQE